MMTQWNRDLRSGSQVIERSAPTIYRIIVVTGTVDYAGTDANVYITLYGDNGSSGERQLDNERDNFEKGQTDVFSLELSDLGNLQSVRIRHDNAGSGPGWFLDRIIIMNDRTNEGWTFPCNRWLARDEDDGQIDRILYATNQELAGSVRSQGTMPTQNTISTNLRSAFEGDQFSLDTLSRFIWADQGVQEQVLENLARSEPPQSLTAAQAALTYSAASSAPSGRPTVSRGNGLRTEQVPLAQLAALSAPRERSIALGNEITAAAYWWGYEVFIPENVMVELTQAPNLIAAATGLLASVLTGPLAVVLGIVAGYIAAEFAAMKAVDRGNGVKLTATWFVAALLLPSAL